MPTTAYDVVEYVGGTFVQTHPARLAAIARLHGVPAASPARCRVLELGTADGGNLYPLALAYPHSEFVGCDLAETSIVKGRAVRDALGAKNLTLLAADLCELPESLGSFDYILAHGVYSWVPDPVRDAILDLCRSRLTPNGIAYVSYNAMPGGHLSQMLSEMLRFHVGRMPDPAEQILQSRNLMRFVHDGTNVPGPLGEVLKHETKRIFQDFSDAVIFHDDLADPNGRFYFHEFAARADRFDLQFLAEADYYEMTDLAFSESVRATLQKLAVSDRILAEQYRDFLCLRRFRQTLLVHSGVEVALPARTSEVANFYVTSNPILCETPEPDLSPGVHVQFDTAKGSRVTLDHPLAKAVLWDLSMRPNNPVPVPTLLAAAAATLGLPPVAIDERAANAVFSMLYQAFQVGMVQFAVDPPTFAVRPGPTPRLAPLSRHELESGHTIITTLRHGVIRIDTPLTRELLLACDGARDWDAILDRLTDWAEALPPSPDRPVRTRDQIREGLAGELEAGLNKAAELALLVE